MAVSSDPILTVSIPTFDRPKALVRLLHSLLPQVNSRITLRIIDNCSPTPVSELVASHFGAAADQRIEILRNRTNIGANANIMRCIEMCETRWLWILGDDDEVLPEAVDTALRSIERYPDSTLLNFHHARFTRHTPFSTTGVNGFAEKVDFIGEVVFISTNIVCADALRPSVRFGCHYTASWMPHVFTLLRALGEHGTCRFLTDQLVTTPPQPDVKQSYSFVGYCIGCGLLLDVPMMAASRRSLARKLHWEKLLFSRIYFHLALSRLHGISPSETIYQGNQIYHRWLRHCDWPIFGLIHWILLFLASRFPNAFAWLIVHGAARFSSKRPALNDLPDATARL